MKQRQALDAKASAIMFVLCMLWGLQQVVLKWAASDISALMQIALRSALSAIMVYPLIQQSVRNRVLSDWGSTTLYLSFAYHCFALYCADFCRIGSALEIAGRAFVACAMGRYLRGI